MKRKLVIFSIIFIMSFFLTSTMIYAEEINVTSESAIVIEQKTGRILFSKNIDEQRAMASTTKIMTAIVAIEHGNLNDKVKVSKNASGIEGSSIWLEENEELTLEELLYGLMLRSGNDAAYAIGEHIGGGDIENFIRMMNDKAKEINALNTSFANPHGLDDNNHYTTAHDLAKITAYAMNNDVFKTIVSTKKKNISWQNHQWNRALHNKNKILWNYEGGNGVKTGYTSKAGKCLVSSAYRNEMQLITVVLKSNNIWDDSTALFDYAFDTYQPYQVVSEDEYLRSIPVKDGIRERVRVYSKKEIEIPIKEIEKQKVKVKLALPKTIEAPILKEKIIGKLELYLADEKIDEAEIYVKEDIPKKNTKNFLDKIIDHWLEN
ncbi:D-alanyl-D-alanine carboxypeptidase [Irregularibacter muris]|uniref:serine-type D-Ala-D-Ala carboxypeptidase n=1 Tax=Irregularibacter muris TaxID=1796619 RepID=A0AAE3HF78_9FIRM|nr:D-alanyl-D-alanine carboxypeptidase family protein [Irregularibacter muris]MCR1898048.1 D-alanyl-D-alanine carboxypeptidase [Irregularibacter muris]